MRSGKQISMLPGEWHDHQATERSRTLSALLHELDGAFRRREPWYMWILNGQPKLTAEEYERERCDNRRAKRRRRDT